MASDTATADTRAIAGGAGFAPCLNLATLSGMRLTGFLRLASSAGFTAVEIPIQQAQAYGAGRVRDLLAGHGLTVAAASGILPAGPVLPAPLLVSAVDYAAHLAGLADRLAVFEVIGCPTATIVLNPRSGWDRETAVTTAVGRLRELVSACADHGVRLAVEVVGVTRGLDAGLDGPHPVASTLPQLGGLLAQTGCDNLTVVVDAFHWAATDAHAEHITCLASGRIGHVQIADHPPGVPPHGLTDTMRLLPGDGALPWARFGQALAAVGYTGPVSVELFNPGLRRLPEPEIAARARRAAVACWTSPDPRPASASEVARW